MMRLLIPLFSPATGTWGGLTRVIAIAEAARARGHDIAFCASGSLADDLRRRGYGVYSTPSTTLLGLPAPLSRVLERRSQHVSLPVKPGRSVGNIWFVLALSGLARPGYLSRLVAEEQKAAEEFQPDAIFTDLDPGALLLARARSLPIASAYQGVMTEGVGSLPWALMNRAVGRVIERLGLPGRTVDELYFDPRVLKIIPSIPELDGTDPARPDVYYVGQLLGDIRAPAPDDFRPEPGRRYVFAYVGTGALPLDVLRRVLPEVFPAGGSTVCLLGGAGIQATERIGNVEFRPYVPASAVLPFCDWTLCHGGQNTIIQSLLNGVPLLVFPGPIFERRFNAQKVQECGAGRMGERTDFCPDWFYEAMTRQAEQAAQARRLAERIRSYGGADAAVTAIERWQVDHAGVAGVHSTLFLEGRAHDKVSRQDDARTALDQGIEFRHGESLSLPLLWPAANLGGRRYPPWTVRA